MHCRSARLTHFRAGARSQTSARLPCFMTLAVERHRTAKIAVSSPFASLTSGFMSALRVRHQQLISAADLGFKHSDHRFTQLARTRPYADSVGDDRVAIFRWSHAEISSVSEQFAIGVSRRDLFGSYTVIMSTKFMVLP